MTDASSASRASTPGTRNVTFRTTLFSFIIAELFSGVLQVYFTPIYPTLAEKFHVSVSTLSWSLTGFTLATVVFTPIFAKLGDVYGHQLMLKIEVAVVALGCILIAVAPNFPVLVTGRVLQGAFAAYLPLMFGLIRDRHSADETRRGVAYLSGVLIFGVLFGLVITSLLLSVSNGPVWVLWLPAVGTLIGFGLLFIRPQERYERVPGLRVDWAGVALLAAGLVGVLWALTEGSTWGWSSWRTLGLLLGGLVLLAIWVAVDLNIAQPLVDLHYVFRPLLLPVYVIGFIIYFGAIGTQVATSTFMGLPRAHVGYGLGLSGSAIGWWLLPGYALMFLAVISTSRLGRAIGYRWGMFVGCACFFVGYLGLVFFHGNLAEFIVFLSIVSAGAGFIEASTRTVVVEVLRHGEVSTGEGIYELAITIGGSVGSAVTAAILSGHLVKATGVTSQQGYALVWTVCAILGIVVVLVALGYALVLRGRLVELPEEGAVAGPVTRATATRTLD